MKGTIQDHRTRDTRPIKEIDAWYVATDRIMSGWGHAPRRSLVAYPRPTNRRDAQRLGDWLSNRDDFQRVRINSALPRLYEGDHLCLYDVPEWLEGNQP
jgi:hypothetical protein